MMIQAGPIEQRREVRLESDEVVRWKRPGQVEDNKAWTVDRSPSGYGFMVRVDVAPKVGDLIHIRRYDDDGWDSFDEPFRVARTQRATDELVIIGCVME